MPVFELIWRYDKSIEGNKKELEYFDENPMKMLLIKSL